MTDVLTGAFLLLGSLLMLLAAVAIVRFPDVYVRMQAATKASTLGIIFFMLGAAVHFGSLTISATAAAIIVFFLLTAPVAAHMIARAAYRVGVPLWEKTWLDELRSRYDKRQPSRNAARLDTSFM